MMQSVPQQVFTAKQVLDNEARIAKEQGVELYHLMEQAGQAVFDKVHLLADKKKKLLILCGKGNNGGDGFVIARLALLAGYQVTTVLLLNEPPQGSIDSLFKGDNKQAYQALISTTNTQVKLCTQADEVQALCVENEYDIIVDAIFGIGFKGELSSPFQQAIEYVNKLTATRIAVDLPSGLNATTGNVASSAFRADHTVTFLAQKQGLYTSKAADYCGEISFVGLGLAEAFIAGEKTLTYRQTLQNLPEIPKRKITAHKGTIGLLLTVGGNQGMPGAIQLTSQAALRSGAALVAACCYNDNQSMLHSAQPELMIAGVDVKSLKPYRQLNKVKCVAIGPGLGLDEWAQQLFNFVLTFNKPTVVDADALTLLAQKPMINQHWILTPHPAEAARLLNTQVAKIERDRFAAAQQIAQQYGGVCLLKGAGTVISDGEQTWINCSGHSAMATGGMGDVLTGIIAALMMQMNDNFSAAKLAAFVHGYIAEQWVEQNGEIGLLASDIIQALPKTLTQYITK